MRGTVNGVYLSLAEVRSVGRTALFLDWGEALLYRDGRLFELQTSPGEQAMDYPPKLLPDEILEHGVGIEFGWRHLDGCDCWACQEQTHLHSWSDVAA